MKRIVALMLVVMFLFTGCVVVEFGDSGSAATSEPEAVAQRFSEADVLNQLEVSEYSLSQDGDNYLFYEITNGSGFTINISIDLKFFDADGGLVDIASGYVDVVGSGQAALLTIIPEGEYASAEYEIEVQEETYYKTAVSYYSYECTPAPGKEIVSVTNNGEKKIESPYGYILFFNGDELVGWNCANFHDDDWELKPGGTEYREMYCEAEYDSYKLYLQGYVE